MVMAAVHHSGHVASRASTVTAAIPAAVPTGGGGSGGGASTGSAIATADAGSQGARVEAVQRLELVPVFASLVSVSICDLLGRKK